MQIAVKLIVAVFILCSCRVENTNALSTDQTSREFALNSELPSEISKFLTANADKWSLPKPSDFNQDLLSYLSDLSKDDDEICPHFVRGDFTMDGKEDFAIILIDEQSANEDSTEHNAPYLVVFNNYQEETIPIVVLKTGLYEEEPVKSVIYSDHKNGILSYLKNANLCDRNVIDIVYFEKSSFLVYWDQASKSYQFLNHLDENLCETIKGENTQ